VDNPEVIVEARVDFITPSEGQKMTGTFTVTGVALKGTRNITGIQLRVDSGQWTDVSGNPGWQFNIDTTGLSNGNHILEARAFDGTDYSDTVARTARVDNPVPVVKPKVDFITPYEGQVVSGNISVTGVVEKGSQDITYVQVRIDYRLWLNVSGNPGWQYMLDANRLRNGNHTIEVRAFDGTYFSDTAIRTVDVENPRPKSKSTVPMLDGLVIMALFAAVGALYSLKRK
jgi:hypothetical protein